MAAKHSTRISSVGAATIGQGDIRVIVNALGTVTPIATVAVQTQLSGRLLEVGFTEGGQGTACDEHRKYSHPYSARALSGSQRCAGSLHGKRTTTSTRTIS